ncbi:MAG: nickel transporter [Hyphomicrobium aestuarii]|mgnify:CR=1 FL=1|nr:nickel transporter [Hyphomicrobium aestuarii]
MSKPRLMASIRRSAARIRCAAAQWSCSFIAALTGSAAALAMLSAIATAQVPTTQVPTAQVPPVQVAPTQVNPAPQKSPLGVAPSPGAQQPSPSPGAPLLGASRTSPQAAPPQSWWAQALAMQQAYVRDMAKHIRALKSDNPGAAAMALASIAFLYGVLHAAGPGHGKAVISSYVLANRDTARRGIALSFLAAFFQACSAILFVAILALILRTTATEMKVAEAWIERASWLFVIAIGGWLLWRQIKPLLVANRTAATHIHASPAEIHRHADGSVCTHDHGHHDHDHGHKHGSHDHGHASVALAPSMHGKPHVHADGSTCNHAHEPAHEPDQEHSQEPGHVHGPDCGHAHMPAPQDLEGPWSWRRAVAIALGIGMRPCTGAILLMVFALSQGLLWAGIFATFMMSLGTAITVSLLAVLAVTSRDLALRLTGGIDSRWGQRLATGVGILAAVLVIALGVSGLAYPTPEPMFTNR